MKKTNRLLALLLVIIVAAAALTSCFGGQAASTGTATIAIERGEGDYVTFEVDLSKLTERNDGAFSLLKYIASQKDSTLYYNVQWGGGYGAYITAIDTLSPNPTNQYIAIYTSEKADFAVPTEWTPVVPTVQYGEMTLTYSGVGLSEMHVNDGTVILFRLEGF